MLIHVPLTIVFDCGGLLRVNRFGDSHARTLTMRYDVDDTDVPASYTMGYPPAADARWTEDRDGVFFGLMPSCIDAVIAAKARKYPADYCADAEEGQLRAALDAPAAVDWNSAADASKALDAGLLPDGHSINDDGALVIPDTPMRSSAVIAHRFPEIVTETGRVVKSRRAKAGA